MPAFLICMQGLSGSGKTTVAKWLAATFDAELFRSDLERKYLFGLTDYDNSQSMGKEIYSQSATRTTFLRLHELATRTLQNGHPVILDAAFLKLNERAIMRQLAKRYGAVFIIVKCLAKDLTLRERIRKRRALGNDASEATEDLIDRQKHWEEPLTEQEMPYCITLFTESPDWEKKLQHQLRLKIPF